MLLLWGGDIDLLLSHAKLQGRQSVAEWKKKNNTSRVVVVGVVIVV